MRMPFAKAHHAVVCIRHEDGYREHFDRDTRAATLRFLHEIGACKHVPRQTIPDDRCHPLAYAFECSPSFRSELRYTSASSSFRLLVTLTIDLG